MTLYKKAVIDRLGRGWPVLEVVDIPATVPEYTANRDVNLPQLLERQVISVRDPRQNADLPSESIYNKPVEYEHIIRLDDPDEPDEPSEPPEIEEPDDIAEVSAEPLVEAIAEPVAETVGGHSDQRVDKEEPCPDKATDSHQGKANVHLNPKFFPKLRASPTKEVGDGGAVRSQDGISPVKKEPAGVVPETGKVDAKKTQPMNESKATPIIPCDDDFLVPNDVTMSGGDSAVSKKDDILMQRQDKNFEASQRSPRTVPEVNKKRSAETDKSLNERMEQRSRETNHSPNHLDKLKNQEEPKQVQGADPKQKSQVFSGVSDRGSNGLVPKNTMPPPAPLMVREPLFPIKEALMGQSNQKARGKQVSMVAPQFQPSFKPLSQYARPPLNRTDSNGGIKTDAVRQGFQRDFWNELQKVANGKVSKYEAQRLHFGKLSIGTEIESSLIPEIPVVKRLYLEALRDWQKNRPLEQLANGGSKFSELKPIKVKSSLKIDTLAKQSKHEFEQEVLKLTAWKEYKADPEGVFKQPSTAVEDASNQLFRQAKQYMSFLVSKSKPGKPGRRDRKSESEAVGSKQNHKRVKVKEGAKRLSKDGKPGHRGKAESPRKRTVSGDMYSPTRPTDMDDEDQLPDYIRHKRKSSKDIELDPFKKEKKKTRKESVDRSRSRSKSRGKDLKRKNKDKKHKKEKDKAKKDKRDKKAREKRDKQEVTRGILEEFARERRESEMAKMEEGSVERSTFRTRQESERSDVSLPSKQSLSNGVRAAEVNGEAPEPVFENPLAEKAEDGGKEGEAAAIPKVLAPKKEAPITAKQRELAKATLKVTAAVFYDDPVVIKVVKQLGLMPVAHEAFCCESPPPQFGLYDNSYAITWCVLQFFMNKDYIRHPDDPPMEGFDLWSQFIIQDLDPENSFLWALLLAIHEDVMEEMKKHELILKEEHEDSCIENDKKNVSKGKMDVASRGELEESSQQRIGKPGALKAGGNKLILAFKQAIKIKNMETQTVNKPSVVKLTPEQAAKKPPKHKNTGKSMFKPPIAYTLEQIKPTLEGGPDKEFYTIGEITKLNDLNLMDSLVKNAVEIFLAHTLELLKANVSDAICENFTKCLQPIVLKNMSNIRNMLILATNLLGMFKSKQGADLFKANRAKKTDEEEKEEEVSEDKVEERSEPEEGELSATSTPNHVTDNRDVPEQVSEHVESVEGDGVTEYRSSVSTAGNCVEGSVNKLSMVGDEVDDWGNVVNFIPMEDSSDTLLNEYGSVMNADNKVQSGAKQVQTEENNDHTEAGDLAAVEKVQEEVEEEEGEIMDEDQEASEQTEEEESGSKRHFRKRKDQHGPDISSEIPASKVAKTEGEAFGQKTFDHLQLEEKDEEAAQSALQKLKRITAQPQPVLEKRIEALVKDEGLVPKEKVVDEIGSAVFAAVSEIPQAPETQPEVTETKPPGEEAKESELVQTAEVEEPRFREPPSLQRDVKEEAEGQMAAVFESPVKSKSSFLTSARRSSFKTEKTGLSKGSSCTATQKVTGRDILDLLKKKSTVIKPEPSVHVKEETKDITGEIENVQSPASGKLDDDLFEQALGKDSISMEMSPAPPSPHVQEEVAPGTGEDVVLPGRGKPKAGVIKSGAPVMYKAEEEGQGIQSVVQDVPGESRVQLNQKSEAEFSSPGTPLPACIPIPVDIPLPGVGTSRSTPSSMSSPAVSSGVYSGQSSAAQSGSYTATRTTTSTPPSTSSQYLSESGTGTNKFSQYPPPQDAPNLPAYDATKNPYDASQGYPDPSASYPPGPYPGYDYPPGYNYYGGPPQPFNQPPGWVDPYYPQQPPPWLPAPGWGGPGWPGPDPSGHWPGWHPGPPPPFEPTPAVPIPPADFSVPPPGFTPATSATPPTTTTTTTDSSGKPPLLGPGGIFTHRLPSARVTNSPQASSVKKVAESKQLKFYVFNKERKVSQAVENMLLADGSSVFDPYNLDTTNQIPGIEVMVFIHSGDQSRIDEIPNLLQLRQDKEIQFTVYQDVQDIRAKRYQAVMEKGGVVMADDQVLLGVLPESLENLLKFISAGNEEGTPWIFLVHSHSLEQITSARCAKPTESKDYQRLTRVQEVLDSYRDGGTVQVLANHLCDCNIKPPHEYLQCAVSQQCQYFQRHRHMMFLTNMPSNHMIARPFLDHGINVISVADFLTTVASFDSCPAQITVPLTNLGVRSGPEFCDVYLSSTIDRIVTPEYDPIEIQIRYEEELAEIEKGSATE